MFKLFIVVVLFVILYSLGAALFHMARGKGDPSRVLRALTWRIALSVALFALIVLANYMGWIEPNQVEFLSGGE